ncbi:MAG: hypothetical protein DLM67_22210 [Candidatus Nephthysia bennettiae]|nr:MAG: hypothetical protein DLM67_22210 [Candidatus Dormibacteraeota bacterium]
MRRNALPGAVREGRGTWIRQRGEIRLGSGKWALLRAEQRFDAIDLGFRWTGKARMAPLLHATVTDAFEQGRGLFEVRMFGFPIQRAAGPEYDAGELLRFLAALPWCPLAFSHPALPWTVLDERTLRVDLERGSVRAELQLEVDEGGQVRGVKAESRPRQVGRAVIPTPWGGRYGEYREYGGMRMPANVEVFWQPPEGELIYFRGEILEAGVLATQEPGSKTATVINS